MNEPPNPNTASTIADLHARLIAVTSEATRLSRAAADVLAQAKALADDDAQGDWRWRRAA